MNDSFSGEVHGVLFFSCIAWVSFSALLHLMVFSRCPWTGYALTVYHTTLGTLYCSIRKKKEKKAIWSIHLSHIHTFFIML